VGTLTQIQLPDVRGRLDVGVFGVPLRVERARAHCLLVTFEDRSSRPADGQRFEGLQLECAGTRLHLGPCTFVEHPTHGPRRRTDPPTEPGDGRIVFLDRVYDFRQLLRAGQVVDLAQKIDALPLVWNRKAQVKPAFRDFAARILFDLQVYRAVFDELDRNLEGEPDIVREHAQHLAVQAEYPAFRKAFDERLAALEDEVRRYSKTENEQHGFFFRKLLWDIILSSEFLARTNLKPRGYAGDSAMMRMIYENEFRGRTIFSQFMHRHPIETTAAQAVRARRAMIAQAVAAVHARRTRGLRTRVMSVACGPAWELTDLLTSPDEFAKYEFALLDQDASALHEAQSTLARLSTRHEARAQALFVRESVRTMLGMANPARRWGTFHVIYSMGLFDYLTQPVAKAVLAKLYDMLAPGGELVVGNFHVRNPTRVYMEYWMDWVLCYRYEDEFVELASGLHGAEADLRFESTETQMFLRVRKP
jgi:extracellular factor (EF) 3-hydroxypalmitic acid methyl ester biosynthesis protein